MFPKYNIGSLPYVCVRVDVLHQAGWHRRSFDLSRHILYEYAVFLCDKRMPTTEACFQVVSGANGHGESKLVCKLRAERTVIKEA